VLGYPDPFFPRNVCEPMCIVDWNGDIQAFKIVDHIWRITYLYWGLRPDCEVRLPTSGVLLYEFG